MTTSTVNPAVLNALTLQYGRSRADLDDQQNRYRINYTSAVDKMKRGLKDTQLKSRVGFSDRGMLHSGASLGNQMDLSNEFTRQRGEASQLYNTNLATIARKRLEAKTEYDTNSLLARLGYTSS